MEEAEGDDEPPRARTSASLQRNIPKNYEYDPKALKPLAKMLWALSVSLGHAMTAHRQFTKLKSATISPDGLVGGRGYVMPVKDVRKALHDACEAISAVSDTIHDEIHAPHWKPKLADLEKSDVEDVERLVGDADKKLEDPEAEADEALEEAEESGERAELEESDGDEPDANDDVDDEDENDEDDEVARYKTASSRHHGTSSIPVQTLGGPRVEHLDRGDADQLGPLGAYGDEPSMDDAWARNDGRNDGYVYENEWENDLRGAASVLPDARIESTPTEGFDFGFGYGADGQGLAGTRASDWKAESKLPNDGAPSVARSDYYQADRGDKRVNASSRRRRGREGLRQ